MRYYCKNKKHKDAVYDEFESDPNIFIKQVIDNSHLNNGVVGRYVIVYEVTA